jgi:hypothetical protein
LGLTDIATFIIFYLLSKKESRLLARKQVLNEEAKNELNWINIDILMEIY